MEPKKIILTLGALLAASVAGNVYLGSGEQVELVGEVGGAPVDLPQAARDKVLAQAAEAGAKPVVMCRLGVISNYPTRVYCTDGHTAGWLLDESVDLQGREWLTLSADKVTAR